MLHYHEEGQLGWLWIGREDPQEIHASTVFNTLQCLSFVVWVRGSKTSHDSVYISNDACNNSI